MMRSALPLILALLGAPWVPAQDKPAPGNVRDAQRTERAQQLQVAVARLTKLAEKYSGLEFVEPPVVEAKTHREWRELIEEEILPGGDKSEVIKLTMTLVGLYLPHPPRVVLSPIVVGPLLAARPKEETRLLFERRVHTEGTIVHELVHALQDQHYKLPTLLDATEDDEEILLYKGLMEGHAVFVEARVAQLEWKFQDFIDRSSYRSFGADPSYYFGHRYFSHVFREHGMKGVHERLANPPTYQQFSELAAKPLPEAPAKPDGEGKDKPGPPRDGSRPK
ncbi:MAG: hypothetical protein VYE77_10460 [Planctomycetota bacterium]|nr:hypothetical protein [Planctomycetota bacterium]